MLAVYKSDRMIKGFGSVLLTLGVMFLFGASNFVQSAPIDFDNDGKEDVAVWGADHHEWWHLRSSDSAHGAVKFGSTNNDVPMLGDFTGDGILDSAFYRFTTAEWFILRSEDYSFYSFPFGLPAPEALSPDGEDFDIPTPGDFDGDGKTDAAVYRFASGTWYVLRSSDLQVEIHYFGIEEDQPVIADYDGDGKDDIAIYRHSTGEWWLKRSRDGIVGYTFTSQIDPLGGGNRIVPTPTDFTGDGKADVAFFEPSSGSWYILRSENPSSFYSFPFGNSSDLPASGDYDGDGKADAAVYRRNEGMWYIQQSREGFKAIPFGTVQDIPLATFRSLGAF